MTQAQSILTKNQKKIEGWKAYTENGQRYRIKAEIRFDDECNNGHNTFAITGEIERLASNGRWMEDSCGCIHEDIAKHFPHLRPFIKWHLTSSDQPMHYVANTVYHAGNRDYNGLLKGEIKSYDYSLLFNNVPIRHKIGGDKFIKWVAALSDEEKQNQSLVAVEHDNRNGYNFRPHHTLSGYPVNKWHECPLKEEKEANEFLQAIKQCKITLVKEPCAWGKGKERDFDAARACAVWPDATDEQLSLDPDELRKLLEERQESLMQEFRQDMEKLGFVY